MKLKPSSVAAGAAIIFAGTLLSRLLGWYRDKIFLHAYGDSWISGAYYSAFNTPDLLYNLLAGGALSAAFIPIFSSFIAKSEQENANRVGSTVANLMLIALAIGVTIQLIFTPFFVRIVAPGYVDQPKVFELTVSLTRVLCSMVLFTALSGLLTGMLQSYRHFLIPAITFNIYNLGIIFGVAFLSKVHVPAAWAGPDSTNGTLGIYGAALGVLIGALCMVLVQIPAVLKHGFRFHPIIDLKHPGVRQMLWLLLPALIGFAASIVNLQMLPQILATKLGPSAMMDVRTATRLVILPFGLFAVTIVTAAFPKLSGHIALGEMQEFRDTFNQSLKAILIMTIPATIGMFVLAEPLNYLLWGGGEFTPSGVRAASFAVMFLTWGLLGISVLQMVNRAFFAMKKMVVPLVVSVSMILINLPLSLYLSQHTPLKYGGITLSTAFTMLLAAGVTIECLRRCMGGIGGRDLSVMTLKVMGAAAAMGVVMYYVAWHFAPSFTFNGITEQIGPAFRWPAPALLEMRELGAEGKFDLPGKGLALQFMITAAAGVATYFGLLWLLRVREMKLVTDKVMRKFRRKRPTLV